MERIIAVDQLIGNERELSKTFEFQAEYAGTYERKVLIKPDFHIDLDLEESFKYEVLKRDPQIFENSYFEHEDDVKAAKTKNLFAQLMDQNNESEDEGEEEEEVINPNKNCNKKVQQQEGSDDEEELEEDEYVQEQNFDHFQGE